MKLFTTEKERKIKMEQLRPVSKLERILFPIIVTIIVCLLLPTTAPLVGMLMLGNLFKESGCCKSHVDRDCKQRIDVHRCYSSWYIGRAHLPVQRHS